MRNPRISSLQRNADGYIYTDDDNDDANGVRLYYYASHFRSRIIPLEPLPWHDPINDYLSMILH